MLKKHISVLVPSGAAALSECSVSAPVSLRPALPNTQSALIGQLTHAWASTTHNNKQQQQQQQWQQAARQKW